VTVRVSARHRVRRVPSPDPDADWWSIEDIATYLGVAPSTVSSYRSRGQMPAAERHFARTPVWRPATITAWHAQRRGKGWRGTEETNL